MKHLSIVIPAYNEEKRIEFTLLSTLDYLKAQTYQSEIIVVNDGSTDKTVDKVNQFHAYSKTKLILLENPGNKGKGYSVRNGMLHSTGDISLFMDADLATPLSEIVKVITPIINGNYDIVFGSRKQNELVGNHQSFIRELRGRGGNLFMRALLGIDFYDTQCGFKAFKHNAIESIFPLQRINGFGFDPELLFIGQKQGWRIAEMPVKWNHIEGSKVTLLGSSIEVLSEVFAIRFNDLTGKYKSQAKVTDSVVTYKR